MHVNRIRSISWVLSLCILCGCGSGKVSTSRSGGGSPDQNKQVVANADDVLGSAIFQLRPVNFGINANTEKPVSLLNSWRFKQAEKDGTVEQKAPPSAPANWYSSDKEAVLSQSKFDLADAQHIRDGLLFRTIAGYLSDRGQNELQRIGVVVDFVCRNISLWKNDEVEIPMKPHMSIFFGRGSAEDRAWICAEIFRQLRIDSIVVRAKSDEKEATDKWLFGVIIDKKIYLFDLRLALPIASGTEVKDPIPAKLDEIISHPEWLELMGGKESYTLTVDDLKDPTIYVISDPLFWCKRMQRLEQVLPASDNCVIYEGLTEAEGKTGLLDRIAEASGQPVDRLKPWNFSTSFEQRMGQPNPNTTRQLQIMAMSLVVPIPFTVNEEGKSVPGTPERKMERYRMMHLLGNYQDATQRYLSIRRLDVEQNPPEVEQIYKLASEDAFYWTAICKIESEDHAGAIDLLSAYLKKYDRRGKWFFAGRTLLAQEYVAAAQTAKAVSLLERSSSEDPNREANAVRLKRWSASTAK